MNPTLRLTLLFVILSPLALAQTSSKPTIAFQQFNAERTSWAGQLYEATISEMVNSGRLNVVNRTPEMWKAIENELALQDFIDPKSAINLGKMSGAKYLLSGDITQFTNDYVAPTSTGATGYYRCAVAASLKILNLERGQYEQSVEASVTTVSVNSETATQNAIRAIAKDLSEKVQACFPISAQVVKQTAANTVMINQGSDVGVREHEVFTIYAADSITDIGSVKITWVAPKEATGRVLRGDIRAMEGRLAKESRSEKDVNAARIEKKDGNRVIINAGKDLAIKKGDIFKSERIQKVNVGSLVIDKHEELGKIYITKVEQDYSEGKIYRGVHKLDAGMSIVESNNDQNTRRNFFRVGYKTALNTTIKANTGSGDVTVKNSTNTYTINTGYLKNFKDIRQVNIYTVAFGTKNLVKDLTTAIQADIYDIGLLQNWIGHLDVLYDKALIPEVLFWSIGPSVGYGRLKQHVPNDVIGTISGGESDNLKASSLYAALNTNLNVRMGRFVLTAGVSVDYLKYQSWKYNTSNKDDKAAITAPDAIIPYATVDLSGVYYSGGLSYYINR